MFLLFVSNKSNCVSLGWGCTDNSCSAPPAILQKVKHNVLSSSVCSRAVAKFGNFTESMICAGAWAQEGKGATVCGGDSGGPLTVQVNQQAVLIGAVSFGGSKPDGSRHCVSPVSVFGNIAHLRNWITTTMNKNEGTAGSGCIGESFKPTEPTPIHSTKIPRPSVHRRFDCNCGKKKSDTLARIINGNRTKVGFPVFEVPKRNRIQNKKYC